MGAVMLTTIDNPFNPFTQWDDWLRYDEDKKQKEVHNGRCHANYDR